MTDRGTAARRTEGATGTGETTERREDGGTGTEITSAGRVARHPLAVRIETGAIALEGLRLHTNVAEMMSLMAGEEVPGMIAGIFLVTFSL